MVTAGKLAVPPSEVQVLRDKIATISDLRWQSLLRSGGVLRGGRNLCVANLAFSATFGKPGAGARGREKVARGQQPAISSKRDGNREMEICVSPTG